ncbi:cytochrome p450 protein [Diplodia corticola]|uniref:Cytochrome p450 protein n=1 Tax=Diplodia corticola TaxID=236234 RepID=A0A1J9SA25_9PEZI|nr:cytochrome p450 protein [Diplodia corticola]OJD37335.1 cytochrome p450 protein [Diplodia corticola]
MKLSVACGSLASLVTASVHVSRADTEADSLYGYGVNIGGLPFIYADGLAYLGSAPSNASVATNVTVSISSGVVVVTPTDTTWTGSKSLYIDNYSGAYEAAKIVSSASGYTNSGFMFYGRTLFQSGTKGMESLFYATPLDSLNQTYLLEWNSDSIDNGASTPVALRNLPPA